MKGTLRPKHKGRIYAKLQYDVELMVQQQVVMIFIANYKAVSTLFDFCINPSHEGNHSQDLYTREGFMQKPQMIWNLPIHIVRCVVMIFIANYKEIIRCVLFLTFA